MQKTITTALKLSLLSLLLAGTAACSGVQSSPNMVDYSYVPANQSISVISAPGIESF